MTNTPDNGDTKILFFNGPHQETWEYRWRSEFFDFDDMKSSINEISRQWGTPPDIVCRRMESEINYSEQSPPTTDEIVRAIHWLIDHSPEHA